MSSLPAGARAAVAGRPIEHSRSPLLHSRAYALLGHEIAYGRIDAGAEDAAGLATRLRSEEGWVGLSATMPLKQPLLEHMDELSDTARRLGAMNTVVVRPTESGVRLAGTNTDVDGIVGALTDAGLPARGAGRPGAGGDALILGGGGTSASALAALARLGLENVVIAVRNPAKAAPLRALGEDLGLGVDVTSLTSVTRAPRPRVVVSTLPPRAGDEHAASIASLCAPGVPLLDVAYDPWPSALVAAWRAAGGVGVHGLAMLVHQAVEQIALFTGDERATQPWIVDALCDAADIPREGARA